MRPRSVSAESRACPIKEEYAMPPFTLRSLLIASLLFVISMGAVQAQNWPDKPVRILIG